MPVRYILSFFVLTCLIHFSAFAQWTSAPNTFLSVANGKLTAFKNPGPGPLRARKQFTTIFDSTRIYQIKYHYCGNNFPSNKGLRVRLVNTNGTVIYNSGFIADTGTYVIPVNQPPSGTYRMVFTGINQNGGTQGFNNRFFQLTSIAVDRLDTVTKTVMVPYNKYRYQFQGQEADPEIKGEGNSYNYKYRMHDSRLGRFFSIDPLAYKFPHNGSYNFSENILINGVELEGLEVMYTPNYGASAKSLSQAAGDADGDFDISSSERKIGAAILSVPAVMAIEAFLTKGWLTRSFILYHTGESMHETDLAQAAKARGDTEAYNEHMAKSGEHNMEVLWGLAGEAAVGIITKLAARYVGPGKSVLSMEKQAASVAADDFVVANQKALNKKLGTKIGQGRLPDYAPGPQGTKDAVETVRKSLANSTTETSAFVAKTDKQIVVDIYSSETGYTVRVNAETNKFVTLIKGKTKSIMDTEKAVSTSAKSSSSSTNQ